MTKTLFITLAIFLYASALAASDAVLRADLSIDKKRVLIGDRITVSVEVKKAKDVELVFPKFEKRRMGPFEIVEESISEKNLFGKASSVKKYVISLYEVGKVTVPEIEIRYKRRNDKEWKTAKTKPVDVSVESALPKGVAASDIRDIKVLGLGRDMRWIFSFLGAVFAVAAIIISAAAVKNRLRKTVKLAHETAFEEIEAARALLLKDGDIKNYYVGVSDTVRRYIERTLNLRASEMTTPEFLESLKGSESLRMEQKEILKSFLNACDMVKFAKYQPTRHEIELVYLAARRFIEEQRSYIENDAGGKDA